MNQTFKKLNYKDQEAILALNSPNSFSKDLDEMASCCRIITDLDKIREVDFAIVFVTKQEEVDHFIFSIFPKLKGDAIIWFCYPKGTSKNYKSEINRDQGWESLGKLGLEPVRQVAIDEDWSALRFRKVEFIKSITRRESFALSEEAKRRTLKKGE